MRQSRFPASQSQSTLNKKYPTFFFLFLPQKIIFSHFLFWKGCGKLGGKDKSSKGIVLVDISSWSCPSPVQPLLSAIPSDRPSICVFLFRISLPTTFSFICKQLLRLLLWPCKKFISQLSNFLSSSKNLSSYLCPLINTLFIWDKYNLTIWTNTFWNLNKSFCGNERNLFHRASYFFSQYKLPQYHLPSFSLGEIWNYAQHHFMMISFRIISFDTASWFWTKEA